MQPICIHEKKMPANLNALIRYKTIDRCLSNPYRKWTIGDLMDACASALEENRGIYSGVSERTTREDIRIMRSNMLGFSAPIVQKDGHYYYEDRNYSIFNVSIRESKLLSRIYKFILEIQSEVDHPDMEEIIKQINRAIFAAEVRKELSPEERSGRRLDLPKKGKTKKLHLRIDVEDPETDKKDESVSEQLNLFESLEDRGIHDDPVRVYSSGFSWAGVLKLIK